MPGQPRRIAGFTLIEMMIVVAAIAILAAVALPSYREYIKKSRRAEAQSYLLTVAGRQQQFLVDTRGFSSATDPADIAPVPKNVDDAYTLKLEPLVGPPPTFTLTATPKPDQDSEKCGKLTINQAGAKTAKVPGCW
ncbi:MAG: type IV pilin protein [Burkholderiaceae bacterium]